MKRVSDIGKGLTLSLYKLSSSLLGMSPLSPPSRNHGSLANDVLSIASPHDSEKSCPDPRKFLSCRVLLARRPRTSSPYAQDSHSAAVESHNTFAKNVVFMERTLLKAVSMASRVFELQLCNSIATWGLSLAHEEEGERLWFLADPSRDQTFLVRGLFTICGW